MNRQEILNKFLSLDDDLFWDMFNFATFVSKEFAAEWAADVIESRSKAQKHLEVLYQKQAEREVENILTDTQYAVVVDNKVKAIFLSKKEAISHIEECCEISVDYYNNPDGEYRRMHPLSPYRSWTRLTSNPDKWTVCDGDWIDISYHLSLIPRR